MTYVGIGTNLAQDPTHLETQDLPAQRAQTLRHAGAFHDLHSFMSHDLCTLTLGPSWPSGKPLASVGVQLGICATRDF